MSRNDRIIKKLYETPEEREMKRFIVGLIILGVITIILAILTNFGRYDNEQEEKELPSQLQYIAYETFAPVTETTAETETAVTTEAVAETSAETTAVDPLISLGEFRLTAYCSCVKCCDEYAIGRPVDETGKEIVYTASGTVAKMGRTIAVDTRVIPYGTSVIVNGNEYIAEDCGGAIKGNRIDVYFDSHTEANNFGVQYAEVFIKTQEG